MAALTMIEPNGIIVNMTNEIRYDETIGGRIHWLRKNQGMTIAEVAKSLNVRASHLSNVENNKGGLSVDVLGRLVQILHSTMDYVVMGKGIPNPDDDATPPPHWSDEADAAAALIDAMPERDRPVAVAIIRAMAGASEARKDDDPPTDIEDVYQRKTNALFGDKSVSAIVRKNTAGRVST